MQRAEDDEDVFVGRGNALEQGWIPLHTDVPRARRLARVSGREAVRESDGNVDDDRLRLPLPRLWDARIVFADRAPGRHAVRFEVACGRGGLTGKTIKAKSDYTVFSNYLEYNLWHAGSSCYEVAKHGQHGGVLASLSEVLEGQSVRRAVHDSVRDLPRPAIRDELLVHVATRPSFGAAKARL